MPFYDAKLVEKWKSLNGCTKPWSCEKLPNWNNKLGERVLQFACLQFDECILLDFLFQLQFYQTYSTDIAWIIPRKKKSKIVSKASDTNKHLIIAHEIFSSSSSSSFVQYWHFLNAKMHSGVENALNGEGGASVAMIKMKFLVCNLHKCIVRHKNSIKVMTIDPIFFAILGSMQLSLQRSWTFPLKLLLH